MKSSKVHFFFYIINIIFDQSFVNKSIVIIIIFFILLTPKLLNGSVHNQKAKKRLYFLKEVEQ